jgi:hypothetical protein
MQYVSGQYEANEGSPSNERSGVAIQQRQRKGDNATYHYIDHLANAIRFTGRILIDLIPKIYDTPRVVKILGDDKTQGDVQIDPQAQAPLQTQVDQRTGTEHHIFNPNMGRYEVESDVGPAFATRRQETFNALSQLMQADPALMQVAGDLLMQAADFPMADELAERLKRMVPPQALGGAPAAELQKAQQQIEQLQKTLQSMVEQMAAQKAKHTAVEQQKDIDVYKAETGRMEALKQIDPAALTA